MQEPSYDPQLTGLTLKKALDGAPLPGEVVFGYNKRARSFRVDKDVRTAKVSAALVTFIMCCYIPFYAGLIFLSREQIGMTVYAVLVAAGAIVASVFIWRKYDWELSSIGITLDYEIVMENGQIWVQAFGERELATIVSLSRGGLVFDSRTGLNTWRLHLQTESGNRYFDPSRMIPIERVTPYPREPEQRRTFLDPPDRPAPRK